MKRACLLDTNALAFLVAPNAARSRPFADWFLAMQDAGHRFYLPEISYYELRRELCRIGSRTREPWTGTVARQM